MVRSFFHAMRQNKVLASGMARFRLWRYRVLYKISRQFREGKDFTLPDDCLTANKITAIFFLKNVSGGTKKVIDTAIQKHPEDCYFTSKIHQGLVDVEAQYNGRRILVGRGLDPVFALQKIVGTGKLDAIVFEQFIDLSLPLLTDYLTTLALPITIVLHDFYAICPSVFLLDSDNTFCNVPTEAAVCHRCMTRQIARKSRNIKTKNIRFFADIVTWRRQMQRFLLSATRVTVPSKASEILIGRVFPELADKIWQTDALLDCSADFIKLPTWYNPFAHERITIAMVGTWVMEKGSEVFLAIRQIIAEEQLEGKIRLCFIGRKNDNLPAQPGIDCLGAYTNETLAAIVLKEKVSCCLMPSIVAETFCITAQDCLAIGIPVVVPAIGAMQERVRSYRWGLVIEEIREDTMQNLSDRDMAKAILSRTLEFIEHQRQVKGNAPVDMFGANG